ncbi:DNA replication complex GINS family protein [Candidatus Woesearchaeota archaeon]|nr:DNA replication complex GINS family protein [Candidatus Woesearchaeota archaeon]
MEQEQTSNSKQKGMNITYETLFEVLRIEKNRDDLQELPPSFFDDVLQYLREKQQIFDESLVKEDLFSATEREKISNELGNLRRMLKETYERREKKIINMALNKSRTKSNIIDTSRLLKEETAFFDQIVDTLDRFRKGILLNMFDLRQPFIEESKLQPNGSSSAGENKEKEKKDTKLVRFLHPIPKFIGKELEVYGPFEEEDMANLPVEIADVLIGKGRAEEVSEG